MRLYIRLDNRGTQIKVGSKVAFNISGDVAIGQVMSITPSHFKIELQHKAAGMNAGHVSKVKKATSIIVLNEKEN